MNKRLQLVLLLFVTSFCSPIFAGEVLDEERKELSWDSKEPLFISLGSDCYVAGNLVHIGYRRASFPFDWLLSLDHNAVINILDDNFKHFLNPSYYSLHTNGSLINTYYHLEFRHEHDNDFIGKYGRRIDRFRRLNTYSGKIFFIRKAYKEDASTSSYWPCKELLKITFEQALELKHVLKKRFPNLDYTLVIVNLSGDKNSIKVTDDIIFVNTTVTEDIKVLLSKLVKVLPKWAEYQLALKEEGFVDNS